MSFQMHEGTVFSKIVWRPREQPGHKKLHGLTEMLPSNNKNELELFLHKTHYLCKFLPFTAEWCGPLQRLLCQWKVIGHEKSIPKLIWKCKINHQERYIHDILQWKRTAIPSDRYIRCQSQSKSSASKRWITVSKGWHAPHCGNAANIICK